MAQIFTLPIGVLLAQINRKVTDSIKKNYLLLTFYQLFLYDFRGVFRTLPTSTMELSCENIWLGTILKALSQKSKRAVNIPLDIFYIQYCADSFFFTKGIWYVISKFLQLIKICSVVLINQNICIYLEIFTYLYLYRVH